MYNNNIQKIDILYITYNRLEYTRKTLPALIRNAGVDFKLTIFDNGSTDGTVEYLKLHIAKKYSDVLENIFLNEENIGISIPTNIFWKTSQAEYIGKVDNDTLLPENWLKTLAEAHKNSDRLGAIGGFHWNRGYFKEGELEKRVATLNGVRLLPDAFIGGCCYLMPRHVQRKLGYLHANPAKKTYGWTEYQKRMFAAGYVNGYVYPLLYVEHFDDPLSKHNLVFTEHRKQSEISLSDKGIKSFDEMLAWYAKDAGRMVAGESLAEFGRLFQ
jgi:GT2 family glycosyltransferase